MAIAAPGLDALALLFVAVSHRFRYMALALSTGFIIGAIPLPATVIDIFDWPWTWPGADPELPADA